MEGELWKDFTEDQRKHVNKFRQIGEMIRVKSAFLKPTDVLSIKIGDEQKSVKMHPFNFVEPLDFLYENTLPNLTCAFEFIGGSSGSGKTQLIWSCPTDRKMLYIPLCGAQAIYTPFIPLRKCLQKCLNLDLGTLSMKEMSCEKLEDYFATTKSYIAGFFKWAIQHEGLTCKGYDPVHLIDRSGKVHIHPIPASVIKDLFKSQAGKVIVALDEINCLQERHLLLRNLLRMLGAKVVLLSTHHSTQNFIDNEEIRASRDPAHPSVYVFKTLPPVLGLQGRPEAIQPLLKSRPWFSNLADTFFSENPSASPWGFLSRFLSLIAAGGKDTASLGFLIGQVGQLLDRMYGW